MTDNVDRSLVTLLYAAGLLALVLGGLDLWLGREGDSLYSWDASRSLTTLLCCGAYRWTLAKGDRAILRSRKGVVASFAIAGGLFLLVTFEGWQALEQLAGR